MRRPPGLPLFGVLRWFGVVFDGDDCARPTALKQQRNGYYSVRWQGSSALLHRLIAEHAEGPLADGVVARHRCGHDWCVNANHITAGTPLENMADQYEHGTRVAGERHPMAKLTDAQADAIRSADRSVHHSTLARTYGVNRRTIADIRSGRRRSLALERAT